MRGFTSTPTARLDPAICHLKAHASCGQVSKNIVLQWGELPTSVAYIGTGQIMGWGNKAIEIRFGFLLDPLAQTRSPIKLVCFFLLNSRIEIGIVYLVSGVLRLDIWTECLCTKRRRS